MLKLTAKFVCFFIYWHIMAVSSIQLNPTQIYGWTYWKWFDLILTGIQTDPIDMWAYLQVI